MEIGHAILGDDIVHVAARGHHAGAGVELHPDADIDQPLREADSRDEEGVGDGGAGVGEEDQREGDAGERRVGEEQCPRRGRRQLGHPRREIHHQAKLGDDQAEEGEQAEVGVLVCLGHPVQQDGRQDDGVERIPLERKPDPIGIQDEDLAQRGDALHVRVFR